jgi:hypothetical protein
MNNEQLQDLLRWLSSQIEHSTNVIKEAKSTSNFGREAQYEGMRDAFIRCKNMISK